MDFILFLLNEFLISFIGSKEIVPEWEKVTIVSNVMRMMEIVVIITSSERDNNKRIPREIITSVVGDINERHDHSPDSKSCKMDITFNNHKTDGERNLEKKLVFKKEKKNYEVGKKIINWM